MERQEQLSHSNSESPEASVHQDTVYARVPDPPGETRMTLPEDSVKRNRKRTNDKIPTSCNRLVGTEMGSASSPGEGRSASSPGKDDSRLDGGKWNPEGREERPSGIRAGRLINVR